MDFITYIYNKVRTLTAKLTAPLPHRQGLGLGPLGMLGVGLLLFFCLSSCHDDDDAPYPSVITELADCPTDTEGKMTAIVLDDDTRLTLSNPKTGLKPSVTYRALVGYTLGNDGYATLYSAKPATLLKDSTAVAISDPTNIVSIWRTGRYINLHLLPKTQGGNQTWGYIVERIEGQHAYLRLHHRQGSDPISYSTDQYASLPLDLVPATRITLRIETFQGTWEREL